MPFVIAWMELERVMENKISLRKKGKYQRVSLMWGVMQWKRQSQVQTDHWTLTTVSSGLQLEGYWHLGGGHEIVKHIQTCTPDTVLQITVTS